MKKNLFAILLAGVSMTPAFATEITRVVTVPVGSEITGIALVGPDLFLNYAHPSKSTNEFGTPGVGVFSNINPNPSQHPLPEGLEKTTVSGSLGTYQLLFNAGDVGIGEIYALDGKSTGVSDAPDFNSFIPTGEGTGYLFTNWEEIPGGISRTPMTRASDGVWQADLTKAMMLNFESVRGTWNNCFGSTSPWDTPLSSEELFWDETAEWNNRNFKQNKRVAKIENYLGHYPNPYDYGYIVEVTDPKNTATPVKRQAMGRFSHENSVVMPDLRTVYLSDDSNGTAFYKFVADKVEDLSAGTLYAAKFTQNQAPGTDVKDATFDITWIELGHGVESEITGFIRKYDSITPDQFIEGKTSYITQEEIEAWGKGTAPDQRVAFLETHKAASIKGATQEFQKMEGVNINFNAAKSGVHPYLYLAATKITDSMSDNEGDIQLAKNPCGAVFQMKLDENFNVNKMTTFVAGGAYDESQTLNACDVNALANPDNLVVAEDGRVFIAEDSDNHENNALWLAK